MPEGLEKLGLGAFDSCSALARISIPDGVTEIEDKTFNAIVKSDFDPRYFLITTWSANKSYWYSLS